MNHIVVLTVESDDDSMRYVLAIVDDMIRIYGLESGLSASDHVRIVAIYPSTTDENALAHLARIVR